MFGDPNYPVRNFSLLKQAALSPVQHLDQGLSTLSSVVYVRGGCEPLIRSTFSTSGLTPNVKYTVRDIGTILAFVRNGLGITIVPSLSINATLEGLRIIRLDPMVQRHIAFAVRNTDRLSSSALQFIQQSKLS